MITLVYGFKRVPISAEVKTQAETKFSIIIPFRNEVENLPMLLETLAALEYPAAKFEVILVNDASEDASEEIIAAAIPKSGIRIKLIQNKRQSASPKKDAIVSGIEHSIFEWITTVDADCQLPRNWLKQLNALIKTANPVLVCGAVIYKSDGDFLGNFQMLDGLSLQLVTIGSFGLGNPLLCNGANLAYRKDAFFEVGGFAGNDQLASGDDIFLLEKLKKTFPHRVSFLKSMEAAVVTAPEKNWKNIVQQRIRWASKTAKQKNAISIFLGIIASITNISIWALPVLFIFRPQHSVIYLGLLLLKICVDYLVIVPAARFCGVKVSFWKFPLQVVAYAFIFVIVLFGSLCGTYNWKGRTFKKQR